MSNGPRSRLRRVTSGIVIASAVAIAATSTNAVLAPTQVAGAAGSANAATQRTSLCTSTGTVTRLTVRRTVAFPQNGVRFSFPSSVDVRGTVSVRRVADALCSLPAMPRQVLHCPADLGIAYHLQFSRADENFRVVTLDATGCQFVSGLVQPRWTARSPAFWRTLGEAMRLKNPSWATFRGSGPGS